MFNITVGLIGKHPTTTGTLSSREIAIGRDPTNDVVLDNGSVSRTHCRLVAIEGGAIVLDEGSRNGTWVNGKPVAHPAVLRFEDELVIGPYTLRVQSLVGKGTRGLDVSEGIQSPRVDGAPSVRERTVVAPRLSAEQRRQSLRWLMKDLQVSTPRIDEMLQAALKDPDAEVRLTAVLAAARLRARAVLPALQTLELPTALQEVEDPRERRFHEQLWRGVIQYLQDRLHPTDMVPGRDPLQPLWQFLAGELHVSDPASLLLYSLTTPLDRGERPQLLPRGVMEQEGRYFLRATGLPLRWVAPVEHWVGAQPLRQVRSGGFFIAQFPLHRPQVSRMGSALPTGVTQDQGPVWLGSMREAEELCEELSRVEGVTVRLPTADEWEMAARGPDGRRFPWGNLPQRDWEHCASPWGLEKLVGEVPEWTFDEDTSTQLLRGGVEARTWVRHEVYPGEELAAALRPVIPGV